MELFMTKVLDDKPPNVLEYAGKFFDSASLREVVSKYMVREQASANKLKHLNDIIKGKTLLWDKKEP